jgi:N-acetylmuramoyl-L-alanine amidase
MEELGTLPQTVASESGFSWELETPGGLLRIVPGSRRASWDGVLLWLGYAPFWSNGECVVHELDLENNLMPLAGRKLDRSNSPRTIVIDAGHGGPNTGTRSMDPPLLEKNLTLDWAFRLEELLRRQGWHVVMTRTNDVELSLSDRVQVADRHLADLFVSLHFNSAHPQTEHAGLETYCLTPTGLPSTLTRDYEDDLTRTFPNNSHDQENLRFAFLLHRALLQATGSVDRGIRRARFMGVLRGQDRPAVLIEAGYLSNPEEARRIATPEHRQLLAEAVAGALLDHAPLAEPHIGQHRRSTPRDP